MAGAGYKVFNTGDVLTASDVNLYLQQQVVMVFASAAARTSALSAVVAEGMLTYLTDTNLLQYYDGAAFVTVNTDQTPLTTKGDLFTFSTTDARLAVGANGTTLVADSSEATGLKYAGIFTSYTPTLTNLTLGNGTVTARFRQIGKVVDVFFNFLVGSTSAVSTSPSFTLPVNCVTDSLLYNAYFQDAGTNTFMGGINLGTTSASIYISNVSGTHPSFASVTATVPFTWTTNDFIRAFFSYEVA